MLDLLRVFVDIALWRRGPQHLPASGLLLLITAAVYCALTLAFGSIVSRPEDRLEMRTALELGLGIGWIWLMLALFGRSQRFFQTATAILGTTALLTPLVLGLQGGLVRLGQTHVLTVPLLFGLLTVVVWYLLITAHILRSALEVSLFVAILLTLLYMGCEYLITTRMLALTAQSL